MDIEITHSIPAELATSFSFTLDLEIEVEVLPEVDHMAAAGLIPAELEW